MPITIKCWNSTTNIIDSIIFKLFLLSLIILFEFCNWVGVDLVFGRLLFRKWVCLPVLDYGIASGDGTSAHQTLNLCIESPDFKSHA